MTRAPNPSVRTESSSASSRSARPRPDGTLQLLEGRDLRSLRGRTRLEHGRLARERIRAFARFACLDVLPAHLDEAGADGDRLALTNVVRDDVLQRVEYRRCRALLHTGRIGDGALQLGLRHVPLSL